MTGRFEGLALFTAVVEAGGVSAAARRLGRSKAAVSKGLAALEERLGTRLLDRSTRAQRLTEAGRLLHERARRILDDLAEAEAEVAHLQGAPRGRLRVSAPLSFGIDHLAPLLGAFIARFPDIDLAVDFEDRYVDLLAEDVDLVIRIGHLDDSAFVARRLCAVGRRVVAAPSYLAAHGRPARLGDLADHRLLHYSLTRTGRAWGFAADDGAVRLVPVRPTFSSNNGHALAQVAASGAGLALLPDFTTRAFLADGRLVPVPLELAPTGIAVHAVWPAARHAPPKLRAFVDFLVARMEPTDRAGEP
jgi:DNA-binding transcriptional LysR family regulator